MKARAPSPPAWPLLLRQRRMVPKLCGGDYEFANFTVGVESSEGTGREASLALLAEIEGVPASRAAAPFRSDPDPDPAAAYATDCLAASGASWSRDYGRKFLRNGGCFYLDMHHLEGCVPEVLSAFDHLAASHAVYRIAQRACDAANARLPAGQRIHVLASNSDGQGNSFGSHLNFLVTRTAWEDIFFRKLQYQGFLAAYQASSIVFTGLGKVGSENRAPPADFQISQRADFIEMLTGVQTTDRRPLLNTRSEALCGVRRWGADLPPATRDLARLHVIFYDHNLCHTAGFLKVGVLSLILAMIEAGHVSNALLLDDPLDALGRWSHDPTLEARAPLLAGGDTTAVDLQRRFLDAAHKFLALGTWDGIVPEAPMIVGLWASTLDHLAARRWGPLSRRLDWVLKLTLLRQTLGQRPELTWAAPELKHLDHLYSSLDPETGLYWACERNRLVERLVPESRVDRLVLDPPPDTRAWTRAELLRRADPACVDRIDWDYIRFQMGNGPLFVTVDLEDPLGFTRADTAPLLPESGDLWDALDALGASCSVEPQSAANPPAGPCGTAASHCSRTNGPSD